MNEMTSTYEARRQQLTDYFDRTAAAACISRDNYSALFYYLQFQQ